MSGSELIKAEAAACALALVLSADGAVSERALRVLGEKGAFSLLAVSRQRFLELARDCTSRIDPGLCDRSWLTDSEVARVDALIDRVHRSDERNLVCRLATAAVEDNGRVTHGARLMLDHVLARWQVDRASVSGAPL